MFTFGNGNEDATGAASLSKLQVDSVVITDGRENSEFNAANGNLSQDTRWHE